MKFFRAFILLSIAASSSSSFAAHHQDSEHQADQHQRAVLITGATSGLGLKMTETLSNNGFLVYAGARKDADMKRLNAMENVEAIKIDVTVQSQIDAAVKTIEAKGRGLYGLINNAGVAIFGPVIEVDIAQLEYQMNVNVYGPYRVTQAFAPLIIKSKGRIVATGSIAGIRASSFFGHYAMSKHAIEAYTESLSAEMARFDVTVGVIEPGNYASQIGNTARKRILDTDYWPTDSQYAQERAGLVAGLAKVTEGKNPQDVADAALHFMSNETPKMRYMVTPNADQSDAMIRAMLQKTLQLNQGQPYSLSKETLLKMLEEEFDK
ncbi:MAG: SDR family oxidoreductase [Arenicella sp.]|nr:SDR family oxidoreductase [Arenicella sp.]